MKNSQSGSVAFRPRARLMKLIGAELISDEVVALVELVKNAHDADATEVTIDFTAVTEPGGTITVSDNGHGMDRETLLGRWMEPASAWKKGKGGRTKRGRRFLGEKGVGRFAADKLAARLEMRSRRPGSPQEIRAFIDWDRFDNDDRMLSDVRCHWQSERVTGKCWHGMVLTLSGLRTTWNERMFRRLSTRLARLVTPFSDLADFGVTIESDEFPDYGGELQRSFLARAPYKIDARFDGRAKVAVRLGGSRPVKYDWNGSGELQCGPVTVEFFAFDLDALARVGPVPEVRAWLKQWTGISVYRDGFRVWPYGEPHDDWLRLDQRRVNNPVVRLSNNQLVGSVHVSRDANPQLRDQTNREGLIQNRALEDLRRLMYFVLQILEAERQKVRHPEGQIELRQSPPVDDESPYLELERVTQRADGKLRKELERVCRNLKATRAEEKKRQQKLIDEYTNLAAVAQLSNSVRTAVQEPLTRVRAAAESLAESLNGNGTRLLRSKLRSLRTSVAALDTRMEMLALVEGNGRKYRRRTINIASEFDRFSTMVRPLMEEKQVAFHTIGAGGGVLRVEMRPELFLRLLFILAANSLDWMESSKVRQISVQARPVDGRCVFTFSDTGPGIPTAHRDRVFEPFFSAKEDGQGLGLAVARELVTTHGGRIEVLGRRRKGAHIRFDLPRKRSRGTH